LEGVVDALRRIHAALETGGVVVDTQPVSPAPPVKAAGEGVGTLDLREWLETITAIDALVAQTIEAGMFAVEREETIVVTDTWDNGAECVETIAGWRGINLPDELAERIRAAPPELTVDQDVRLRLLRAR
jgi:hypothetical protein